MGKTSQPKPSKKTVKASGQEAVNVQAEPVVSNPPIEPEKPAVDASIAEGVQTEPESPNDPQTPNMDATEEAPKESDFLTFLKEALASDELPEVEKQALAELIAVIEAHPDQEQEIASLVRAEMIKQFTQSAAYAIANEIPFSRFPELVRMPEMVNAPLPEEKSEEDSRAERIRAAAQAELDLLYEKSRERQKAAEALAEDAQPDRRENLE